MGKVQLLADQVANQIAAGEVVERPASVVKELVENALDAGANKIEVEIQAGGRNLIRVTDNGCGMERDDALMSLQRHATSKLREASDLVELTSFGFRGEAIPSIASVSLFSLTTRESGADGGPAGTQILVDGGKVLNVKDAGHPVGTTIEVRQLFFNVPARKKFLRTPETERAHIQEYLLLVGLSHPELTLTYVQDHKRIFHLPAVASGLSIPEKLNALKKRWKQFPGYPEDLIEVYHEGELPIAHPNEQVLHDEDLSPEDRPTRKAWLVVWGVIGKPGVSRSTRADQHLFVNRRPVENRILNTAILEGYHTALPKGRYPVGCLFFEIDPAEIDVNIHPAKKEIKFHRERAVRQITCEAVRESLFEFATRETPVVTTRPEPHDLPPIPKPNLSAIKREFQTQFLPTEIEAHIDGLKTISQAPIPPSPAKNPENSPSPVLQRSDEGRDPIPESGKMPPTPCMSGDASGEREPTLKVPLNVIGMAGKNFVLMESDRGLVLMDQRAARARIIFERLLEQLKKQAVASQRLLLPESFDVASKDAEILKKNLKNLQAVGVSIREFGDKSFVLEALPPVVKTPDARKFAIELIDRIRLGGTGHHSWNFGEEALAREMALQTIQQNPSITDSEIHLVIRDLRYCSMPYTSPDGRPTLIEMSWSELDRKFGLRT